MTPPDASASAAAPRSAARSAVITGLAAGVLPLTALVSGPLLARALGPEGRGEMAAVLAPLFVTSFVAAFAIPEATTYAIAQLRVPVRRAARSAARIVFTNGIVAATLLFAAAPLILRGTPDAVPVLRAAVLALPFMMIAMVQRATMTGDRRYGRVSFERSSAAVLRLGFIVVLAVLGELTAAAAVWCNIGSALVAAVSLTVAIGRRRTVSGETVSDLAGTALRRQLVRFGLRGSGGVFANLVSWRLDMAILPAFVGARSLGFYAVAVSLAELPTLLLGPMKSVVFAEASARRDVTLVARAARIILGVVTSIVLVMVLLAPLLVRLLFGAPFAPSTELARLLLLGSVPFTGELILGAGLLSLGRAGLRSVGQLVAAVVTVVGLVALVPSLGIRGAAITSLVAYSIGFCLTLRSFARVSGLGVRVCVLPQVDDARWLVARLKGVLRRRRGKPAAAAADEQPAAQAGAQAGPEAEPGAGPGAEPTAELEAPTSARPEDPAR